MSDDVPVVKTYSLAEVAKVVLPPEITDGVRWLSRRLNCGELSGYRVGRTWRMTREDVEDLIEQHREHRVPHSRDFSATSCHPRRLWGMDRSLPARPATESASSAPAVRRARATATTWQRRSNGTASHSRASSPMWPSMRSPCGDTSTAASAACAHVTPGCPKAICTTTDSTACVHAHPRTAAAHSTSGATALRRSGDHQKASESPQPSGPRTPSCRRGWLSRPGHGACTIMVGSRPNSGAGRRRSQFLLPRAPR